MVRVRKREAQVVISLITYLARLCSMATVLHTQAWQPPIKEGFIHKRRLRSSLMLEGQNCLNSLPYLLFHTKTICRIGSFHQDDLKNKMFSSYFSNRPGEKQLLQQGIEALLSPKQQQRPLPPLLYKSFFYVTPLPFLPHPFTAVLLIVECIEWRTAKRRRQMSSRLFNCTGLLQMNAVRRGFVQLNIQSHLPGGGFLPIHALFYKARSLSPL